jgi:S-adenosylmethionine hydrolase
VANLIKGKVTAVDSNGNLLTDISHDMLAGAPTDETVGIYFDEHETRCIFHSYADQPAMTLMARLGSKGFLELGIVDDSAKIMLGVGVGTPVEVRW